MKINSLKFKNLNSLKGEFEINFDKKPFSECGIFAITGATGSGKTTILDAICIALYHKTPRLEKDVEEIMSRHTYECSTEVEFEAGQTVYRSGFFLHYAKKGKGKLQPAKVELYNVTSNKIIETYKSKVVSKITEITGLNFTQFTRAMMLAQGSFAAFLKSKENDRAELLEKMTGTEIYSEISQKVYEKTKQKKLALESLKADAERINLKTKEELNEIKSIREELKTEEKTYNEQLLEIQDGLNYYKEINDLKTSLQTNEKLFDKWNHKVEEAKELIETLEKALKLQPLETDYQLLKNIRNDIEILQSKIKPLQENLPTLISDSKKKEEELDENKNKLRSITEEFTELKPKIIKAIQLLGTITEKNKNLNDSQNECGTKKNEIISNKKTIGDFLKKQSKLAKTKDKAEVYLKENIKDETLSKTIGKVEELLKNLKNKTEEIISLDSKIKNVEKTIQNNIKSQKKYSSDIEKLKKLLNTKNSKIEKISKNKKEILIDQTIEELETNSNEYRENLNEFQVLLELANKAGSLKIDLKNNDKNIDELKKRLSDEKPKLSNAENSIESFLKQQQLLEENINLELKVKSLKEYRKELQEGEECSLCGSKEHPWGTRIPEFSDKQNQLDEVKKSIKKQRNLKENINTEIIKIDAKLNSFQNEKEKTEIELSNILKSWNENKIVQTANPEIENIEIIEEKIKMGELSFSKNNERIKKCRDFEREFAKLKESISDLEKEKSILEIQFTKTNSSIENNEMILSEDEQNLLKSVGHKTETIEEINETLKPYHISYSDENTVLLENIKKRIRLFEDSENQLKDINEKLGSVKEDLIAEEAKINSLNKEMGILIVKIESIYNEINELKEEKFELIEEKDPLKLQNDFENKLSFLTKQSEKLKTELVKHEKLVIEYQTQLSEKQKELATKTGNENRQKTDFAMKIKAFEIDTLTEFENLRISSNEKERIELLQKSLNEEKIRLESQKTEKTDLLNSKIENPITTKSFEEIDDNKKEISEQKNINLKKQGEIQKELDIQKELSEQHKEKLVEISNHQKEHSSWSKLNSLIGSSSGAMFRNFAQGLTLQKLIGLANKHLKKLDDRYILIREKNTDLEINVLDTFQADEIRPTQNLSGGESFIVSLSLALGLADMNSGKTIISSLFLDEGFGTLDNENLEIALSVLENLHSTGKTIGVISHVKALQERIPTQINVLKKGGGVSEIKIKNFL